ncbi:MAG: hypothetical protein CMM93_01515 [Rickettsiales bacterium]|nr:hypothetical protein [Rickettsiales bacterium]|tara:strand:+ start:1308 stop:1772 length:465 start_codon:yes stop_codon:yes gene_type:complete
MAKITNGEELFNSIKKGLQEAAERKQGKSVAVKVHPADSLSVARIREKTGLSQADFAATFGFNLRTLQDWESGRKMPQTATLQMLRMIDKAPQRMARIAAIANGIELKEVALVDDALQAIDRLSSLSMKRGIGRSIKHAKKDLEEVRNSLSEVA